MLSSMALFVFFANRRMTCTSVIVFCFFKPAECHLLPLLCFFFGDGDGEDSDEYSAKDCEDDSVKDCEDDCDEDS